MSSIADKINQANKEAVQKLLDAQPTLIDVSTAGEAIPNMTKTTILHAGPPITWDKMSGPLRGAVIGGIIYEGLAKNKDEAIALAESGDITFDPCHHHNAVGPMAGVVTYSMPVWVLENKKFGNRAYCTMNEGLGKVLRFGAYEQEVIDRLKWIQNVLGPALKQTLALTGEIDIKTMTSQALQMGDECHNRNKAGTSLLLREIAPALVNIDMPKKDITDIFKFINSNDHFYLNLSMPAAKCSCEPMAGTKYSTLLYTMARNGTEFGIRVAGLPGQWFTAPAEIINGLYFPGYSAADANPDIGDSCITETSGIGGFAMAASIPIVQFVGGVPQDAINYSKSMYEITETENNAYRIPLLNFRGTATGIDIRKVMETGIRPIINTGIACKRAGVGQVGAGLVSPPMACFEKALEAFVTSLEE